MLVEKRHYTRPTSTSKSYSNNETLRLALEVAQLGFWDHNLVNDVIYRSPEWGQMLGYTQEEVAGNLSFWYDHLHPDDIEAVKEEVAAHESGRHESFKIEHRMRTKDGNWKWILNWGRVVERQESGQPIRALGFHLDITDRKHAEAALARADKLSTIGSLAGGIAHDFNNLLTIIQGNLQLAKETDDSSATNRFLANAERATKRSQELTGRLLTFARGGTPSLMPLDIEQVINESRDLVLSGSNSRVLNECEPGLPLVAGSEGQLVQVFQNLLLNSCQAMPEGGIIRVTCKSLKLDIPILDLLPVGHYVEIVISDQGSGIPKELEGRVFDPFFTTKPEGKGLGLATAHSIVDDHKGLLEILPGSSKGASLRLLLPVADADLVAKTVPKSVPNTSAESRHKGRVLIMDDDEMVCEMIATIVAKLGLEPVTTDDGKKAIKLYQQAMQEENHFQVVVMDLTIPGGTGGKETVAKILKIDPAAKVIVSSGYSDDPVMANYQEYGFCASLSKPYELSELRDVFQAVLSEE